MNTIKDLLDRKGREAHAIARDATLSQCARKMSDHDIGSLLVLDGEALAGIFTWHDLIRAVARHGDVSRLPVSDFMSTDPVTTTESASWAEVEAMMVARHVRHLPVLEGRKVVGLVNRHDVIWSHCREAENLSKTFEDYIRGKYPS